MGKNSASLSIGQIRPNLLSGFAGEGCCCGKYQIGNLQIWQSLKPPMYLKPASRMLVLSPRPLGI